MLDPEYKFWRYYNGHEYMHLDLRNLKGDEEYIQRAYEGMQETLQRTDKSIVALVYAKGARPSPAAMRKINKFGKATQPKHIRSAIVGTTGLTTILAQLYISFTGSKMRFFTEYESAMEYLIEGLQTSK